MADITTKEYFKRFNTHSQLFEELESIDSFSHYYIDIQLEILNDSRMKDRFVGTEEEIDIYCMSVFNEYLTFIKYKPNHSDSMRVARFFHEKAPLNTFFDTIVGPMIDSIDWTYCSSTKCLKCDGEGCNECGDTGTAQDLTEVFDSLEIKPMELTLWAGYNKRNKESK